MSDLFFGVAAVLFTIAAYLASRFIFLRFRNPLLNVVLLGTGAVICALLLLQRPYEDYIPARDVMTTLLGPATVALALPLYNHRRALLRYAAPLLAGVTFGTLSTIASALLVGRLLGLDREILLSMAPKSVTAPIAMEIARLTGGDPSLATAFVVATGTLGSMIGFPLLSRFGITDPVARGLSIGTTAHGQGTALALLEGHIQGAMAGIAMALTAIFTSIIAPFYLPWLLP